MTRRMLREHLFKMLFRVEFHDAAELQEQYQLYFENASTNGDVVAELDITSEEKKEIEDKLNLIKLNLDKIDAIIDSKSTDWDIERIGKVELTILRLAVFEMLFDDNVPVSVAINEAVVLTKKYGAEDATAFINGILGNVARDEQ